jgi:hypothetical protein
MAALTMGERFRLRQLEGLRARLAAGGEPTEDDVQGFGARDDGGGLVPPTLDAVEAEIAALVAKRDGTGEG